MGFGFGESAAASKEGREGGGNKSNSDSGSSGDFKPRPNTLRSNHA